MAGEWHDINEPGSPLRKEIEENQFLKKLMTGPALTDTMCDEMDAYFARKNTENSVNQISIYGLSWRQTEKQRKGASRVRDGDTIRLMCSIDGCDDGTTVLFETSWKDNSNDTQVFTSESTKLKEGAAGVNITLDFSRIKKDDFTIHFTASAKSKYGENCNIPLAEPVIDRWVKFEEAVKFIEVAGEYERWEPSPPENRWIYVFGSLDGNKFKDVWEIKTDSDGKYATYKLTDDNYEKRPVSESFEDVAFLPANDETGKIYKLFAALSEFRLPRERIFNLEKGLLADPEKRCLNIDDNQQVARKTDDNGEEHVILINYLQRAEQLRADFDKVFREWQKLRLPSSAESSKEHKKQKLLIEFGALVNTILEAFPKYKKHLSETGYQRLQDELKSYETEKAKKTGELNGNLNLLCDWIDTENFSENCRDYLALITEGDDQPQQWYDFEERTGNLFAGLSRFPRGQETLSLLLKKSDSIERNSWLQDLLLLKNDAWNPDGEQLFDEDTMLPPDKSYIRIRKISQRFIDILAEAARRGAADFKPEEMAKILQKVLRTSGAYFGMELVKATASSRPSAKPFAEVFGSFSEKSFWRFSFDKSISYEKAAARFITSRGLDRLLITLESVSVAFIVKDFLENKTENGIEALERYNNLSRAVTFFAENIKMIPYRGKLVRLGTGPIQMINFATSSFDAGISFFTGLHELSGRDTDCAIWNLVASGGFLISAAGSGALAATFLAGAAGFSATGIGLAPGIVLALTGTVIAIGSKTMADISNNTDMEDLLLRTPWGEHPEFTTEQAVLSKVKSQYVKAVQILNSFSIILDVDKQTAEIQLQRLEPETKISLKEIVFATSTSGKYEEQTVGKDVLLNTSNSAATKTQAGMSINVHLSTTCGIETDIFWMANRPDFIRIHAQVDLFGDGKVILPEKNKMVKASCYYGQETECKII